jgi:hypothetical protein
MRQRRRFWENAAAGITGVFFAPPPLLIDSAGPLRADESQQHVALADSPPDHVCEVHARLDGVHIHEHVTKTLRQPVTQPTGHITGVLPPIRNEDADRVFQLIFSTSLSAIATSQLVPAG